MVVVKDSGIKNKADMAGKRLSFRWSSAEEALVDENRNSESLRDKCHFRIM